MKKAVIICGPTASGKTNFAHEFAKRFNGEIVNVDSMQVYKQLPIITASPPQSLKQELPYHLYNFLDINVEFSAAKYVMIASKIIEEISNRRKLPIIVGGSGMYLNMLIYGFSSIPSIDPAIRQSARSLHSIIGSEEFFKLLMSIDPKVTSILNINDSQRVIRAFEVVNQTGKSILDFQADENILSLPDYEFDIILLMPERKFLYETCNKRFIQIVNSGAIEEAQKIYRHYFAPNNLPISKDLPALKALGVAELLAYIKGEITQERALELASAKTRQYAKRQCTWFNNRIKEKQVIRFSNFEEYTLSISEI